MGLKPWESLAGGLGVALTVGIVLCGAPIAIAIAYSAGVLPPLLVGALAVPFLVSMGRIGT